MSHFTPTLFKKRSHKPTSCRSKTTLSHTTIWQAFQQVEATRERYSAHHLASQSTVQQPSKNDEKTAKRYASTISTCSDITAAQSVMNAAITTLGPNSGALKILRSLLRQQHLEATEAQQSHYGQQPATSNIASEDNDDLYSKVADTFTSPSH